MYILFSGLSSFHGSPFQMRPMTYVYICICFINKGTKSDDIVTAQQITKWFCCQTLQIISLSVFQLCQLWVQILTFNVTFELEEEVGSLSSLLKCDMGKSNRDSSCNDKYECSTCRIDNTGILSTVACGTATSEHSQLCYTLLVIVREHLYLLPIECLDCRLSDIERLFISNQFKKS